MATLDELRREVQSARRSGHEALRRVSGGESGHASPPSMAAAAAAAAAAVRALRGV